MSIRTSAKKVAIAAVMVAPLVLAACGSDDGGDNTASTTTTQSSATSATTTEEVREETTTEEVTEETTTEEVTEETETTEEAAPAPTTEAPVEEPAPAPAAIPEAPITYQELDPVQAGQTASPEDAAAIESLVRGALAPTTVRAMLEYVPKNTCNRVIEAAGGQQAMDFSSIPDVPLNQIPGASAGTVDSITDIMVEGDTASAWVVASGNGQTDSATQRFLREEGRWKFCD